MQIALTPGREAFIRHAIERGRLDRAEDAVTEALLLWEERERVRSEFLASRDESRGFIALGEGIAIMQDSMRALAEQVKRRGRKPLWWSGKKTRADGPAQLEIRPRLAYRLPMNTIEDHTPQDWVDSLARGKAEIEAGKTVPLAPFLDRLRASIARMKARQQEPSTADRA